MGKAVHRISDEFEFGIVYDFAGSPATPDAYVQHIRNAQARGEDGAKHYQAIKNPATQATFRPVLERCWSAMVGHIYQTGRLGNIQPIGFAPDAFTPSSSYVYGVGAFLLAGSEIDKLLDQQPASGTRARRIK